MNVLPCPPTGPGGAVVPGPVGVAGGPAGAEVPAAPVPPPEGGAAPPPPAPIFPLHALAPSTAPASRLASAAGERFVRANMRLPSSDPGRDCTHTGGHGVRLPWWRCIAAAPRAGPTA